VLENFGINDGQEKDISREEVEKKKQKINRKKQIKAFIGSDEGNDLYSKLS
jgi:hypothetical protein